MNSDKVDEPLEFQKEFLEALDSIEREYEEDKSKFITHAALMKEINDVLAETRAALRSSKGVPPPTVK